MIPQAVSASCQQLREEIVTKLSDVLNDRWLTSGVALGSGYCNKPRLSVSRTTICWSSTGSSPPPGVKWSGVGTGADPAFVTAQRRMPYRLTLCHAVIFSFHSFLYLVVLTFWLTTDTRMRVKRDLLFPRINCKRSLLTKNRFKVPPCRKTSAFVPFFLTSLNIEILLPDFTKNI